MELPAGIVTRPRRRSVQASRRPNSHGQRVPQHRKRLHDRASPCSASGGASLSAFRVRAARDEWPDRVSRRRSPRPRVIWPRNSSLATSPRKHLKPHWVSWNPPTATSLTIQLKTRPLKCRAHALSEPARALYLTGPDDDVVALVHAAQEVVQVAHRHREVGVAHEPVSATGREHPVAHRPALARVRYRLDADRGLRAAPRASRRLPRCRRYCRRRRPRPRANRSGCPDSRRGRRGSGRCAPPR